MMSAAFRRRGNMARVAGVAALLACLALAACAAPGSAPSAHAPEAARPTRAPRPPDRDIQAVTVALRKLDACGLLDVSVARAAGTPKASLLPMGPHSCMLSPSANYSPIDDGVEVSVGDASNAFFSYAAAPLTIGGAKAYVYRDNSSSSQCEVYFPVSFTRAVRLQYESFDKVDACRVLERFVPTTAARLQHPDAITVDATRRPFAAWDGCVFLAQLLGQDARSYTFEPDGLKDPFSGCKTTRTGRAAASPDATPQLEVAYDQVPSAPRQARQVGGKVAEVSTLSHSCRLTWNQGDSRTGNQWYAALVFKMTAADCDTAARLAEKAMRLAEQAPGDADAAPQRPLLYGPDENDTGAVGACVDFGVSGSQADCEPYHPARVPRGTDAIMAAAAADRNVQCGVFADAVKARFGSAFNALTWGAHCFFVEPTHNLQLRMNVDRANAPGRYGNRSDLWVERQQIRVAGRRAVSFWDKDRTTFDVYVSPYDNLDKPGNVHIQVEALRGRGDGAIRLAKLDPAEATAGMQVITQVIDRYFAR